MRDMKEDKRAPEMEHHIGGEKQLKVVVTKRGTTSTMNRGSTTIEAMSKSDAASLQHISYMEFWRRLLKFHECHKK